MSAKRPKMDKWHRGAWAELIASTWLLERGHDVFRNVSPVGPADLIALKDGGVLLIDVKTVRYGRQSRGFTGARHLMDHQERMRVVPLYVTAEGVCSFDLQHLTNMYRELDPDAKPGRKNAYAAHMAKGYDGKVDTAR